MFESFNTQPFGKLASVEEFAADANRERYLEGFMATFDQSASELEQTAGHQQDPHARQMMMTVANGFRAAQRILTKLEEELRQAQPA